ncbi:prephenate dehydratase [Lachnoclostridium sp. An181]|uniref:prephenate dehydratase n=1 Tax=Lachnoclostridium sp. An181 TaxID=1965575 RepID=UPI000B3A52A5|nr:prephenate dehydratase [Lachnoclostridium sp. An181]OUP50552.1 bifunctional chorismate mutase/prephenate dehydratase [Lachnoclostridium sp. An181]
MAKLEDLRKEIDRIDAEIVKLYEERMDICGKVAEYKIETGSRVFDKERENEKLAAVEEKVKTDSYKTGARELFQQLMSMSRKLQYQLLTEKGTLGKLPFIEIDKLNVEGARIVFQGTEGAYSQAAMQKYFGEDINSFHVSTFKDAMAAIEEGSADFAVLPIENSSAGAVDQVYDLLVEFENYIVGEVVIPISHTLSGLKGASLSGIRRVYSHPQGLMQCQKYLEEHRNWQQISVANTAVAAQKVLEDQNVEEAAICSEYAAKVHGLEILERQVNFDSSNSTRFIVVTNQKVFLKDAAKVSICFEVPHESGSLYQMLSHFIYNHLNMTKIESRPIEGRTWEYRFFVDFEGNLADGAVKNALRGLREEARSLRILGNY